MRLYIIYSGEEGISRECPSIVVVSFEKQTEIESSDEQRKYNIVRNIYFDQ